MIDTNNDKNNKKQLLLTDSEVNQWDKKFTKNECQKQLAQEASSDNHSPTSDQPPHGQRSNYFPSYAQHASEVRGDDIQGISWKNIRNSRWKYRRDRRQRYEQYLVANAHGEDEARPLGDLVDLWREMKSVTCDVENFFHFSFNARMAHAGLTHFQLRHLMGNCSFGAQSQRILFIQNRSTIHSFDPIARTCRMELDLQNRVQQPFVITTMATMRDMVAIGGFKGEILVKSLYRNHTFFDEKVTEQPNAITNHIQIAPSDSGSIQAAQAIIASNDKKVRFLEIGPSDCTVAKEFEFSFCVNHACIPPNRAGHNAKLLAVLGDDHNIQIFDHMTVPNTKTPQLILPGHLDYCFAASWHPTNDNILVTGSQDKTARVWDMRMTRSSVQLLCGCMGPVRNITFSSDGRYLAFSEPADIVHVYRADQFPVATEQMIDLFGEICGITFSDVDALGRDSLFAGVFDRTYNSVLQFDRSYPSMNSLDNLLV